MKRYTNVFIKIMVVLVVLVLISCVNVNANQQLSLPKVDEKNTVVWDCIYFGKYPQSKYNPSSIPNSPQEGMIYRDSDGTEFVYALETKIEYGSDTDELVTNSENAHYYKIEPIKWRVLQVNTDYIILVSDKCLDSVPYYDLASTNNEVTWESIETTWEESTIREWLNNNFLNYAFTDDEIVIIQDTNVVNEGRTFPATDDEPELVVEGGNDTIDKVYLLSYSDMFNKDYGFVGSYSVFSANTDFAIQKAAHTEESGYSFSNVASYYWLRSPGNGLNCASTVCVSFYNKDYPWYSIDHWNGGVYNYGNSVRPVIQISKNSSLWEYAGMIDSNNTIVTSNSEDNNKNEGSNNKNNINTASSIESEQIISDKTTEPTITSEPINVEIVKRLNGLLVKNKKGKKISAVWKQQEGIDKYQIQYALNKKFTKKKKTKTVAGYNESATITKLKKGKTYYVRVRAGKKISGKMVYGKWSAVKKVKIKK